MIQVDHDFINYNPFRMQIKELIGNKQLLDEEKTLFLCSKHTPFSLYDRIFNWVETLNINDCIMCFNSSELEEELFKALLVNNIPTILFVMNKFVGSDDLQIKLAMKENRLLVVVLKRDEPKGKGLTPRLRNEYVIQKAKNIVCGYVNPNGSVFPMLAGWKNVRYLEKESENEVVAESYAMHYHWIVGEDKTLLRMYYEDMGLYAIKKRIGRSFLAVRNRIRSLALSDEVLKGREFEEYILGLFRVADKNDFILLEWRGDKMFGDVKPENNSYPDFVIKCKVKGLDIAVECKWRNVLPRNMKKYLLTDSQYERYKEFSKRRNIPVFLFLGIGGDAAQPKELYVIPLNIIHKVVEGKLALNKFKKDLSPISSEYFTIHN